MPFNSLLANPKYSLPAQQPGYNPWAGQTAGPASTPAAAPPPAAPMAPPAANVPPAAPASDTSHVYSQAEIDEIARRGGDVSKLRAGQQVQFAPVYGSEYQNNVGNLGYMPLDQQIPENFIQNMRARQAANAAAQVVFDYDPVTGAMRPKNNYQLSPLSSQYDPSQWSANNALMGAAGANYMQGQANKYAMPGEQDYRNAIGQNQNAVQQVGVAAQGVRGSDAVSRYGMQQQLGQYGQDLGMLRATAAGTGPSAAQGMLRAATDQNVRSQMQLAAGARGGNVAAANRAATEAGANAQQQSASQLSTLRAQEQLQGQAQLAGAQSQYSSALQGLRTGDQAAALNNVTAAAQAQQAAQSQVNAQQGYTQTGQAQYGQGLQEQAMGLQYGNQGVQNQLGLLGLQAQVAQAAASGDQAALSAALQYYSLAQQGQLGWQNITTHVADTQYQRDQMEQARQDAMISAAAGGVGGLIQGGMNLYGQSLAAGRQGYGA